MTTNTSSFASLFAHADAAEILELAKHVDITGMDAVQLAEYQDALECLKEQVRIDAEYQADVVPRAEKPAFNKPEIKDVSNIVGCRNLEENAFVPQGREDTEGMSMQNKLRHENGDDELIPEMADDDDDDEKVTIQKGYRGDPDDGAHQIILVDYPDRQQGRNGNSDYRVFHFRDTKLYNEWTMFVSEDDLVKRLQEISYNNRGMLSGLTKKKAFACLMMKPFSCWTVKNQKGKVVTYFDEVHFNKYFTWVMGEKAAAEDAYAQRHSAKADVSAEAISYKLSAEDKPF